jgi:hypothetical protein
MGILQQKTVYKPTMNGDVDVLVDRSSDKKAAVLAIIRGEVSPATAERNS